MTDAVARLDAALAEMPVVAILRGLGTDDAIAVVEALHAAGIRVAEVPLNSPDPYATIALLVRHFGDRMVIGAGTVTSPEQVARLAETGAAIVVSPNSDGAVIAAAIGHGMVPLPGCATPTEAFAALAAGARHLKYFPAIGRAEEIAALRTVLPSGVTLLAVGGVGPDTIAAFHRAGVAAFGIGSDIYKPGRSIDEIAARARALVRQIRRPQAARLLCNPLAVIGESPMVLPDGSVHWTDPVTRRLFAFRDGQVTERPVEHPLYGLAMRADGGLIGTGEACFASITSDGVTSGPAAALGAGSRFNDMTVDPLGGLWAGAMHKAVLATRGALFHAPAPDREPRCVAQGLGVPNGMAFAPDGRTLFVIDTLARTLIAYPADPAAGTLGEPVIVSDFMNVPGKPDGMIRTPEGHFWVAMWGGGCVAELAPDGALFRTIPIPAPHISSVALSGSQLFVTTSRMRLSADDLARHPDSGGLFVIALDQA
ncbi:2-dehydro-3-deoxy-6-phosphogalactonate aldolase [Sphingomonas sp. CJ20]